MIWSRTILLAEEMCAMEKEETESPYCISYPHVTLNNGIIPLRTSCSIPPSSQKCNTCQMPKYIPVSEFQTFKQSYYMALMAY